MKKLVPIFKPRTQWEFIVPGDAKGQPRQRHFARKIGEKYMARSYDPGTAEGWKCAIAIAVREAGLAGKMITGPVHLRMFCSFTRPKSHFGSGKNAEVLKVSAPSHHVSKPDLDNIEKAAKDAFTQLGVWRDDCQVCRVEKGKSYAMGAAFTLFEIAEITA